MAETPHASDDSVGRPTAEPEISGFKRNLPNTLTGFRVLLAALFVVLMTKPSYLSPESDNRLLMGMGFAIFLVAALTDALDGYLARKWDVASVVGRILDPFADKILVLGAFVMLAGPQFAVPDIQRAFATGVPDDLLMGSIPLTGIQSWMVVVILARDLLVTTLRGMVEGRGKSFAALSAGKAKMIVQSIGIPLILLMLTIEQRPLEGAARWVILASAWGVTLVTAWSAIPYCLDARKKLKTPA